MTILNFHPSFRSVPPPVQVRSLRKAQDVRKQLVAIMDRYKLEITSCGRDFTKVSKAIVSGGSASAFFGMRAISAWVPETACTRSEPAEFPATKAGPCSPPLVASAFRSSRRPFSLRAGPWHFTQFASKIGWISFVKSTVAAHAGETPSAAMAKPRRSKRWKGVVFMRRDSTDGAKAVSLQKSSDRSGHVPSGGGRGSSGETKPAMNDPERLQAWATRRDEPAFAELVRLHLGLVYGSALRQVREPVLAQEVAQAVFLVLADKAGLPAAREGG